MSILGKAARVYREDGAVQLAKEGIRFGYDSYIRPQLPKQTVLYNNVTVQAAYVGDSFIPWHATNIPTYEGALVRGIRQYVEKGDTVVIVGGGWGVSTVIAARQVGDSGHVVTFEGSNEAVKNVEDTARLNDVDTQVSVHHAIVARAISLRGNDDGAQTYTPDELPECDVLVLDCEGAEVDILEEMEIRPRTMIVETHGIYGATEAKVRDKLNSAGYRVIERNVAEGRLEDVCEEKGIYVIYAEQQDIRSKINTVLKIGEV